MNEFSDPKQLPDVTRRALADFVLALADTKRFLGMRYAEWCDGAPALEASVAASAMAQDELGHSRALLPLLKEFPEIDPGIPDEAPRSKYSSVAFLDKPFSTWPTFVAANVLIGEALTTALQSAQQSCYVPLRTRAVKILEEERFHWLHGEGWFKRIAKSDKEAQDLAAKVEEILPQALCWFGRPEDDQMKQAGILEASPEELRARLLNRVGPLIIASPAEYLMRIEGGRWQLNGNLPWAYFDSETRRVDIRR
jgi:1,2-phenylacetyl-CoA epoxidase catalytic subunit